MLSPENTVLYRIASKCMASIGNLGIFIDFDEKLAKNHVNTANETLYVVCTQNIQCTLCNDFILCTIRVLICTFITYTDIATLHDCKSDTFTE